MGILDFASNVVGSLIGADASRKAAHIQQDAAREAQQASLVQRKPYIDAGAVATTRLAEGSKPGGEFNKPFTMADAANSEAEKYALKRGLDALEGSSAAKSGLLNTNAIQAGVDFGQQNAVQFESQAFDQWLKQLVQQIGIQQNLSGVGAVAANGQGDIAANAALASGAAGAGAVAGTAGIWGSLINQTMKDTSIQDTLKGILGTGGGISPTGIPNTVMSGGPNIDPNASFTGYEGAPFVAPSNLTPYSLGSANFGGSGPAMMPLPQFSSTPVGIPNLGGMAPIGAPGP